jgi:HlyD family secretion protein
MRIKPLAALAAACALAAVALYFSVGGRSSKETGPRFVTVPVERGALTAEISCTGTLSPLVEVLVGSQVSGTIQEIYADYESVVKKDQMIALIDPRTYEAKVGQAKADLEAAKAELVKAEVTLVDERRNLERKEGLLRSVSVSQSEYDAAKTKADAAEAQAGVNRARVAQMEAKLREAELQLLYTRITAPVDGVVTARNVDVGQTVAASFQAPVMFKIAEDLRKMQVNTNVDEADIGRVRVGLKATFTVPAFPEETFHAVVRQIRNEPKIEQNVVTYNVVLDVDNNDLKLRPGMTANVSVLLDKVSDALYVPDQALRFVPRPQHVSKPPPGGAAASGKSDKTLWVPVKTGKLKAVSVKTGLVGGDKVQIISDELGPGDPVVVGTAETAKPDNRPGGMRLRF